MRPHLHWAPLSNGPLTRISDTQVFSTEVKLLTACLHVRLGGETPFYKKAAKSHVVFVDSHIKHVCAAWLCISINGRQKTMYRNLPVRHNMFHLRRLRHDFFFTEKHTNKFDCLNREEELFPTFERAQQAWPKHLFIRRTGGRGGKTHKALPQQEGHERFYTASVSIHDSYDGFSS